MKRIWLTIAVPFSCLLAACVALPRCNLSVSAGVNKKAFRAAGEELFAEKGCSHCHGPSGFGGTDSGPDLKDVRKRLQPEQIAHQIHDGGKNMPPFGDSLTEDQIASLVEYLHSKRKAPKIVPAQQHPPATPVPTKVAPE